MAEPVVRTRPRCEDCGAVATVVIRVQPRPYLTGSITLVKIVCPDHYDAARHRGRVLSVRAVEVPCTDPS